MNAEAIPAGQLACLLQDTAAGICADTAAIELIAGHGHFLHQPGFRQLIAAGSGISAGEPVAVIRWKAAIHALDTGRLPCSSSEQAVLRIAASLGDPGVPVCLRAVLGTLDRRNIALVTDAITAANGRPPPPPTRAGCAGPPAIRPSAPDLKGTRP